MIVYRSLLELKRQFLREVIYYFCFTTVVSLLKTRCLLEGIMTTFYKIEYISLFLGGVKNASHSVTQPVR